MSLAIMAKALQGDTKAFEVIRDTLGQKPAVSIDIADPYEKAKEGASEEIADMAEQLKNPVNRDITSFLNEGEDEKQTRPV